MLTTRKIHARSKILEYLRWREKQKCQNPYIEKEETDKIEKASYENGNHDVCECTHLIHMFSYCVRKMNSTRMFISFANNAVIYGR